MIYVGGFLITGTFGACASGYMGLLQLYADGMRDLVCGILSSRKVFTDIREESSPLFAPQSNYSSATPIYFADFPSTSMYESDPFGTVTLGLSFASNITTVALVSIKAWYVIPS